MGIKEIYETERPEMSLASSMPLKVMTEMKRLGCICLDCGDL